jgi:hypothetical protein
MWRMQSARPRNSQIRPCSISQLSGCGSAVGMDSVIIPTAALVRTLLRAQGRLTAAIPAVQSRRAHLEATMDLRIALKIDRQRFG